MPKYLCKLWSANRSIKKAFMCQASIALIIKKARDYSLEGNKLALECDGTEIDDDETLEAFLKEKSTLIILNACEVRLPSSVKPASSMIRTPPSMIPPSAIFDSTTAQQSEQVSQQRFLADISSCLTPSMIPPSAIFDSTTAQQSEQVSKQKFLADVLFCPTLSSKDALLVPVQSSPQEESSGKTFPQNNCQKLLYNAEDENTNVSTSSERATKAMLDLFYDFEIPWNKISTEIHKVLEDKKPLGKLLTQFSNTIVNELRQKSEYIPMSVYRRIAKMAATKYPESFLERDAQQIIMSRIPLSLITTMRNRNNFLNSSAKKGSNVPSKQKINTMSRSCVNWQPISCNEEEEDCTSKKQFLITMHQKKSLEQSEEETVLQYMADCFAQQRKFFNNALKKPTVQEILQNWPMIFYKKCLFQHFEKLMELDVSAFNANYRASAVKLKAFFKIPETGNDEDIIKAISKHFKENHELLFSKFESKLISEASRARIMKQSKKVMPSESKLNKEQCVLLANIYKGYRCLWDETDITYRFSNRRREALQAMHEDFNRQSGLNLTQFDVQSEIGRLRKICSAAKKYKIICKKHNVDFKSTCDYYDHIEYLEVNVSPFECPICSVTIPGISQYKIHVASHDGSLPFKCHICGHGFKLTTNLGVHLRRHAQDHLYKCTVCDKEFPASTDLKIHKLSHTGEKHYICDVCGLSFKKSSQVNAHMRRHNNKYSHRCEKCDKGFFNKTELTEHVAVHHSQVRSKICNVCNKAFKSGKSLRQHKLIHAAEKRYLCKICDKRFAQPAGLSCHLKSHDIVSNSKANQ